MRVSYTELVRVEPSPCPIQKTPLAKLEIIPFSLHLFLPDSNCVAIGGYTFYYSQDEITFTATCKSLPFFTITGGKGKYMDAVGFIQFMIEVDDGFIHEINLCRRSESSKP
jgi:hypothetical protein